LKQQLDHDSGGKANQCNLLEAGGYLQWEEANLLNQDVRSLAGKDFEAQVNKLFVSAGLDYRYFPLGGIRLKYWLLTFNIAGSLIFPLLYRLVA
jgi:hypothetical protein